MKKNAIYLCSDQGADPHICRGLQAAGWDITSTQSVRDVYQFFDVNGTVAIGQPAPMGEPTTVLVVEVQAGAIPLLTLLGERQKERFGSHDAVLPPTLLFDRNGDEVLAAVKALHLGVRDYVLGVDPARSREWAAWLFAERSLTQFSSHCTSRSAVASAQHAPAMSATSAVPATDQRALGFEWDGAANMIYTGGNFVGLSQVQGRIFDVLLNARGKLVPSDAIISLVFPDVDAETGLQAGHVRLRTQVMRLRRKLRPYPALRNRVHCMRGKGYMFK